MSDTAIFVWLIAAALTFLAALTELITVAVVMVNRDHRDMRKRAAIGWPPQGVRPRQGAHAPDCSWANRQPAARLPQWNVRPPCTGLSDLIPA